MKKIYLLLVLILLTQQSCKNNKNNDFSEFKKSNSNLIEIKIDPQNHNVLTSDQIFGLPQIVRLETLSNNLIGSISQILIQDSLIIINDRQISKSIMVFDLKGNFKNRIGQQGQGPGEYVSNWYVCLLPRKDKIAILDDKTRKVLYYRFDGKFLYSKNLSFDAVSLEYIGSEMIAYLGFSNAENNSSVYDNNPLILTDSLNNSIASGFKNFYKPDQFTYSTNYPLRKWGNNVYYNPSFNDTIFQVTENEIISRYFFNWTKYGMPKVTDKTTNEDMERYLREYMFFNGDFIETQKAAIFYIHIPGQIPSFVIYDKTTNETFFWNQQYKNPCFMMLYNVIPQAVYLENTLVYSISPATLITNKKAYYEVAQKENISINNIDNLLESVQEDDNPVLFFYPINLKK